MAKGRGSRIKPFKMPPTAKQLMARPLTLDNPLFAQTRQRRDERERRERAEARKATRAEQTEALRRRLEETDAGREVTASEVAAIQEKLWGLGADPVPLPEKVRADLAEVMTAYYEAVAKADMQEAVAKADAEANLQAALVPREGESQASYWRRLRSMLERAEEGQQPAQINGRTLAEILREQLDDGATLTEGEPLQIQPGQMLTAEAVKRMTEYMRARNQIRQIPVDLGKGIKTVNSAVPWEQMMSYAEEEVAANKAGAVEWLMNARALSDEVMDGLLSLSAIHADVPTAAQIMARWMTDMVDEIRLLRDVMEDALAIYPCHYAACADRPDNASACEHSQMRAAGLAVALRLHGVAIPDPLPRRLHDDCPICQDTQWGESWLRKRAGPQPPQPQGEVGTMQGVRFAESTTPNPPLPESLYRMATDPGPLWDRAVSTGDPPGKPATWSLMTYDASLEGEPDLTEVGVYRIGTRISGLDLLIDVDGKGPQYEIGVNGLQTVSVRDILRARRQGSTYMLYLRDEEGESYEFRAAAVPAGAKDRRMARVESLRVRRIEREGGPT